MAEAPAGDETLVPDDVLKIAKELSGAQNKAEELGLQLKLPPAVVQREISSYSTPRSKLFHIIIEFLKRAQPRPTWRVIINALRSPTVDLPALAERVEAAHFPDATAIRDAVPDHETTPSVTTTTTDRSLNVSPPAQTAQPSYKPSGTAISEYQAVLSNLETLVETLRATPRAENALLVRFKEKGWVGITATAEADPLITKALNEIKNNVGNYKVFIDMLEGITGMDEVVGKIEEKLKLKPRLPPPSRSDTCPPIQQDSTRLSTESEPTQLPNTAEDAGSLPQQQDEAQSSEQDAIDSLKENIKRFENQFNELKDATVDNLEKRNVKVEQVTKVLTSLPADDVDELSPFIKDNLDGICNARQYSVLFALLSLTMNYLSYQLLEYLIKEFKLDVKGKMEAYKSALQQFRQETPLTLFCRTQKKKHIRLEPYFKEVIVYFKRQDSITLEVVEEFRQKYACHYRLRDFAMMLGEAGRGSFKVTWFIPESIVGKLREKVPKDILEEYSVTKLEIAGLCVYQQQVSATQGGGVAVTPFTQTAKPADRTTAVVTQTLPLLGKESYTLEDFDAYEAKLQHQDPLLSSSTSNTLSVQPSTMQSKKSVKQIFGKEESDYPFVEQPSGDFFCPVMTGLLLQPHLTLCCGKHLSQEAATRILGGGRACPLCNARHWLTMLNKHFQRQVKELHVFCRHKNRGCGWQGELSDLERHVQSCDKKDQPQINTLPANSASDATTTAGTEQKVGLFVQCSSKARAPCKMTAGSATTHGQFSYFTPADSNSIYSYRQDEDKWKEVPPCPYYDSGLVIINEELTAVGGCDESYHCTCKLFTLRHQQWVEKHPPMNTARSETAVVSTSDGEYIIVIGGFTKEYGWIATVELFQLSNNTWHQLKDLPFSKMSWSPYTRICSPSATICGDQLYVIGEEGKGYSCSLQALLSSDRPITSQSILDLISWTSLPPLPVKYSIVATLSGQLVSIGGASVSSIHQLINGQWVEIGSMSRNRSHCLAASQSSDKILIVGGRGGRYSVEELHAAIETAV